MSESRWSESRWVKQQTLGKGDCAFNAFVLCFFNQEVIAQLEANLEKENRNPDDDYQKFIQLASEALKVSANWKQVKDAIFALSKEQRQIRLAPVMRQLAIDLVLVEEEDRKNNPDQHPTIQPLLAAFDDFVSNNNSGVPDDIFRHHDFIQTKFQELKSTQGAKAQLCNWWKKEGYTRFLGEMRQAGKWAGDLELRPLCKYFHVNGIAKKNNTEHYMHIEQEEIWPNEEQGMTGAIILQLQDRNVIDAEHRILPLTEQQVGQRLSDVPESDEVKRFINEQHMVNGRAVPDEWSSACKQELVQRNVITRSNENQPYQFTNLSREAAIDRVQAIAGKEQVLQVWRDHHKEAPTIVMHNDQGVHWEATEKVSEPKPIDKTDNQEEQRRITYDHFYTEMLTKLEELAAAQETAEKTGNELAEMVAANKAHPPQDSSTSVEWTYSGESFWATKENQEKLDAKLAKKLQQEEYEDYLNSKRNP